MTSLVPNLVKRIERLPKPTNATMALQPLFEAISNSIHSTQAKFDNAVTDKGKVVVNVIIDRKKEETLITVEDNGVGLDARNFTAFQTTDTDNKIAYGGKGVGRLLWLDCFQKIRVESVFKDAKSFKRRKFDFVLALENQIRNDSIEPASDAKESGFYVKFFGLQDNGYKARFPGRPSYIFQHMISHFLPIFIGRRCPLVTLHAGDDTHHFPKAIDEIVHRRDPELTIKTFEFGILKLTLMECGKVASADLKGSNFVHFIAHDRTVVSQSIDAKLGLKNFGDHEDRVFHAVLTGDHLDSNVNQERTSFMFEDSVIDRIINEVCAPHIEKFLAEPLSELRGAQREKIEEITESYPSVSFGGLDELQSKIPSGELHEDAIYGHLARERFRRDQRQAEKIRSVLAHLKSGDVNAESFASTLKEAGKAIEDAEQRSLAEYVVRRKVVLDFIEVLLQKVRDDARDNSYQREDVLHSFICPLRVNTLKNGDKRVEAATSHDLWIVDERLTFARYFSSDTDFAALSAATDSKDRPDILIFDHVHGLRQTKDPSKILLIEFKRPGRTSYKDDENPQMQVQRYVKKLLAGTLNDVKGRPIKLGADTVFYCFVVADIVGKLDEWTDTWPRTADGRGRFMQPQHGFKGSIEIISWDALLTDARARNEAFFDSVGISGKSYFSDS